MRGLTALGIALLSPALLLDDVLITRGFGTEESFNSKSKDSKGMVGPLAKTRIWDTSCLGSLDLCSTPGLSIPLPLRNFEFALKHWELFQGGAGASAAAKRKRNEGTAGDGSLAHALVDFLATWTESPTTQPKAQRVVQVSNRPQEHVTPTRQSNDQQLARSLIQFLKDALNQGTSDQELVHQLKKKT